MRVAFASSDGRKVDCHFGQAEHFHLWEVEPERATAVGKVGLGTVGEEREDRILARAEALDGCTLVYTTQIGGPAAAKLVSRHIQAVKAAPDTPIAEAIAKLQGVLKGKPPPWLRKALDASSGSSFQTCIPKEKTKWHTSQD